MRPPLLEIRFRWQAVVLAAVLGLPANVAAQTAASIVCRADSDAVAHVRVFQRWIQEVWHDGRVELVPELVGPTYVRHEAKGSRTVTAAQYAAEISSVRRALPGVHFLVHDCTAAGDRLWVRWTMVGAVAATGDTMRRMGLQGYRLESGRLVETWMLMEPTNAVWPDASTDEPDGGRRPAISNGGA